MTNTEGAAGGLDYPKIRTMAQATVDYLNKHGGIGGRKVKLEACVVKASPETSAACAQELVGKKVDAVLLGLDITAPTSASTQCVSSGARPGQRQVAIGLGERRGPVLGRHALHQA